MKKIHTLLATLTSIGLSSAAMAHPEHAGEYWFEGIFHYLLSPDHLVVSILLALAIGMPFGQKMLKAHAKSK